MIYTWYKYISSLTFYGRVLDSI